MMKQIPLQILLIILIINIALFAIANTERRVALVWGNSSYSGWDNLPVCTNDADTIADKLAKLGFDTILLKNGTRDEMLTSLEEFEKRIEMEKTDVAVFSILAMHLIKVITILSHQTQNLIANESKNVIIFLLHLF